MYVCIYICVQACLDKCVCNIHVFVYVCMYVYTHIHTNIYIHIHTLLFHETRLDLDYIFQKEISTFFFFFFNLKKVFFSFFLNHYCSSICSFFPSWIFFSQVSVLELPSMSLIFFPQYLHSLYFCSIL